MTSILVVTYDPDLALLEACLDSVRREFRRASTPFEVLILENGSPDAKYAEDLGSDVRVIKSHSNLGFGVAMNKLVRAASGDYCLLLNPDAILERESAVALTEALDADAVYVGRLQRGERLQVDAYWLWWTSVEHFLRRPFVRRSLSSALIRSRRIPVEKACGGALAASRNLLLEYGPFDQGFFLYGEDADLSLRLQRDDIRIWLLPAVRVTHHAADSMARHSALVEEARADAAIRLSAIHRAYLFSLWVRLDLTLVTLAGIWAGGSSNSARTRLRRIRQVRRWGMRRTVPAFRPGAEV